MHRASTGHRPTNAHAYAGACTRKDRAVHGNGETRLRVTLFGTLEVRRGNAVVAVPGARLRA